MTPPLLQRLALAALVLLALATAALALVPIHGDRSGALFALAKLAVIGFMFVRVLKHDVYTMQWSSMLILLFVAEGVVRAMTDPAPASLLGALAALASVVYFGVALAWLRPLKKAAREARR